MSGQGVDTRSRGGAPAAAPAAARENLTALAVLHVDDSETDGLLVARELRRAGYALRYERVQTAAAMTAALEHADWDVILCDHEMPRFNAPTALELLQRSGRDIPFIVVTGALGEEFAAGLMKAGAHDFVKKSNLARLVPAIEREVRESASRREHRSAEAALRENQERLRLAVDSARIGLWDFDVRTGQSHYSASWRRVFGYEADALTGSLAEWNEMVHPDDRESVVRTTRESFRDAASQTASYQAEFRLRHRDGRYRWVLSRAKVLLDAAGQPSRMLGAHIDVTERKSAEMVMASENRVLERIAGGNPLAAILEELCRSFETIASGLWCSVLLLDDDGIHLRHGAAPSLPAAYSQAIDGMTIGPAAGSCGTAAFRRAAVVVADTATDPLWADFRALAREHGLRSCWSTPILAPDGAVLGTFAVYYTEPRLPTADELEVNRRASSIASLAIQHTRAVAALRQQSSRLQVLHEIDQAVLAAQSAPAVADAVLVHVARLVPCQRAGILVVNDPHDDPVVLATYPPGVADIRPGVRLRATPMRDEILQTLRSGRAYRLDDLTPLVGMPAHEALLAAGLRSGLSVPLIAQDELIGVLNLWADRPAAFTSAHEAVARELAAPLAIAIRQVSLRAEIERHAAELEQRVRQRTADLEAANRELDAFSYSVSHDLRAPLRVIDGFTVALGDDYAGVLDTQGRGYLERVRTGVDRMRQLIDDLLGLSRISRSQLDLRPVDLSALARATAAELRQADPSRQVEFVIAPDLTADGDPRLLGVMLANLLDNAWKYTSKHPTARIELGRCPPGPTAAAPPAPPVFFVRDDGAGFDPAQADKLFGAFQRLHSTSDFEGTGIGLATVQRIVRRHGGRIWAEAAVERGAIFYFTLAAG